MNFLLHVRYFLSTRRFTSQISIGVLLFSVFPILRSPTAKNADLIFLSLSDSNVFVAFDDDVGAGRRVVRSVNEFNADGYLEKVGKRIAKREYLNCDDYPTLCRARGVLPGINKGSQGTYSGMIYPGGPTIGGGGNSEYENAQFIPHSRNFGSFLPGTHSDKQEVNSGMIYPGGPYIGGGGSAGSEGAQFYPRYGRGLVYWPEAASSRSLGRRALGNAHENTGRRGASAAVSTATAVSGHGGSSALSSALSASAGRRHGGYTTSKLWSELNMAAATV